MKGLILKDLYQLKSYSRVFIAVLFMCVLMAFDDENTIFLMIYPSVIMGMMPITMYAYDEKAKFHGFLATLPVKKQTYVTAKYLFGLGLNIAACLLMGSIQMVQTLTKGTFIFSELAMAVALALAVGLVAPAVILPFIFALGTEKGRFVNIIAVGFTLLLINVFMNSGNNFQILLDEQQKVLAAILVGGGLYFLSCCISIVICNKKEY